MGSYQVKLKHHFSLSCYQFKLKQLKLKLMENPDPLVLIITMSVKLVNHDNNKVIVMKILITVTNKQFHAEKCTKIHYKSYFNRSYANWEIANLVLSLPHLVLDSVSYAP